MSVYSSLPVTIQVKRSLTWLKLFSSQRLKGTSVNHCVMEWKHHPPASQATNQVVAWDWRICLTVTWWTKTFQLFFYHLFLWSTKLRQDKLDYWWTLVSPEVRFHTHESLIKILEWTDIAGMARQTATTTGTSQVRVYVSLIHDWYRAQSAYEW